MLWESAYDTWMWEFLTTRRFRFLLRFLRVVQRGTLPRPLMRSPVRFEALEGYHFLLFGYGRALHDALFFLAGWAGFLDWGLLCSLGLFGWSLGHLSLFLFDCLFWEFGSAKTMGLSLWCVHFFLLLFSLLHFTVWTYCTLYTFFVMGLYIAAR